MKIDVIGGSGFIGTRLCEKLEAAGNIDFLIIDKRPSVRFSGRSIYADVRSVNDLRRAMRPGAYVINLAAEHQDNVRPINLYEHVNIDGAKNICNVAREKGVSSILFTSSVAAYGDAPAEADESTPFKPFNEYGRTKAEAEKVYREWLNEDIQKRSLVIVRPAVVFGERNRGNVYNLMRQIKARRFVMVGSGRNIKSIAYVGNVSDFMVHCLSFSNGLHISNYVDKPDFSTRELVNYIRQCMSMPPLSPFAVPFFAAYLLAGLMDIVAFISQRPFPISSVRIRKFCSDSSFSSNAAAHGFNASCSLRDALSRTVAFEFDSLE